MTVEPPRYNNRISAGNLITMIVGLVTATGMWFVMDERGKRNQSDIKELEALVAENVEEINDLKLNDVRLFEKLDNIFVGVQRIEAYLGQQGRP